jgi:rRNA maturation RNase YbeY
MPMMNINFFFQGTKPALSNRTSLKIFLADLFERKRRQVKLLNYIFVTDPVLRKINKDHLGHDYFTDIVTFDLSPSKKDLEAEIYISVDRVKENAKTYRVSFKEELHRVIFHGALHLLGYKDKSVPEKKRMRAEEEKLIELYL